MPRSLKHRRRGLESMPHYNYVVGRVSWRRTEALTGISSPKCHVMVFFKAVMANQHARHIRAGCMLLPPNHRSAIVGRIGARPNGFDGPSWVKLGFTQNLGKKKNEESVEPVVAGNVRLRINDGHRYISEWHTFESELSQRRRQKLMNHCEMNPLQFPEVRTFVPSAEVTRLIDCPTAATM